MYSSHEPQSALFINGRSLPSLIFRVESSSDYSYVIHVLKALLPIIDPPSSHGAVRTVAPKVALRVLGERRHSATRSLATMRVVTPQIAWHGKLPIFSCDFNPSTGILATAGADKEVKLWRVAARDDAQVAEVTHVEDLTNHTASVNTARFSPDGTRLATCGDRGEIIVWHDASSRWQPRQSLRGHGEDVLAVDWSRTNADALASCSVDNTTITWNVDSGRSSHRFDSHSHYAQGVACDPRGEYLVDASADKSCRIYRLSRAGASGSDSDGVALGGAIFHDDTLPSFFRRCEWSPDGSFVVCPAGTYTRPGATKPANATFAYARGRFDTPAMRFPGGDTPSVCVRFNPVFYKHRGGYDASVEGKMLTDLPYRFVFAVCGVEGVAIYDTDETKPIAIISAIHYAAITDCAWAPDGSCLVVTSTDGYASLITFDAGELGEQASAEDVPADVASMLPGARVSAAVERLAQKPTSMPVMQAPVRAKPEVEETAAPGEVTQARRIAPTRMTE